MPRRTSSSTPPATAPRGDFRQRYDDVERRRAELVARLSMLSGSARTHPGYKRAQTLLNATFRKAKLGQRDGVLQAAAWLIAVLERMTTAL